MAIETYTDNNGMEWVQISEGSTLYRSDFGTEEIHILRAMDADYGFEQGTD